MLHYRSTVSCASVALAYCMVSYSVLAAEKPVTISKSKVGTATVYTAHNTLASPITITLDASMELNTDTSPATPVTVVIEAGRSKKMLEVKPADARSKWRFNYVYHWRWGSNSAIHAPGTIYELPYTAGRTCEVIQGFNGSFSHTGKHAVDWAMDVGTPVCAARAGVVVEVVNRFEKGGRDPALREKVNRVRIHHSDGTQGLYVHFRHNGVIAKVGDKVARGGILGFSGNTGYSTTPHLHFEVVSPIDGYTRRTFWARFNTSLGRVFLRADESYARPGK